MAQQAVTMALIGAGNRGRGIFGQYALNMAHRAQFVAVVEPDEAKRTAFAQQHRIPAERCFADIRSFLAQPRLAQAVVIATLESEREEPIMGAIKAGYHILVEKPLGCTPQQVLRITDAARQFKGIFIVCHQMRHIVAFDTIKKLITSGQYGEIVGVQHSENLSWHHMAHSFVRGFFNNDRMTPMILAKSCHDTDILRYLIDRKPVRVASFGSLTHFRPDKAPAGAPKFCLDGCPAYQSCPYHVLKIYFGDDVDPAYIRQMGVVRDNQHLMELLRTNAFGRCVFHCDNNVVDHQVMQVEFEGGVTASFCMYGHNYFERRILKLSMTNGEISFDWHEGIIRAYTFAPPSQQEIRPDGMRGSHGGGDRVIMDAFVDAIVTGDRRFVLTPVEMSLEGHLLAFAAEESRRTGQVVQLAAYEQQQRAKA
jgi:predicted dehydrogenase